MRPVSNNPKAKSEIKLYTDNVNGSRYFRMSEADRTRARLHSYKYSPRRQSVIQQLNKTLIVNNNNQEAIQFNKDLKGFEEQETEEYQQQRMYIFVLIRKIPVDRTLRSEDNMGDLVRELPKLNIFFKNYSFMFCCGLLKIAKIRFYELNDIVYDKKQQSNEFGIILWGKVRLGNKLESFKKISRKGDTLSQQLMFTSLKQRQQKCTSLQETYIIWLQSKMYTKFYETMIHNGLKAEVLLFEKSLRRNMLFKNTLRANPLQ